MELHRKTSSVVASFANIFFNAMKTFEVGGIGQTKNREKL